MQDRKRDTDVYNSLLDSVGEGEVGMIWENGIETCILSCKKWIFSLGYRILGAGALGWPRRMVWGGFKMGNTCTLMVDSGWCMAKPIQYCKVKKKN